jgi:hypothetical protein
MVCVPVVATNIYQGGPKVGPLKQTPNLRQADGDKLSLGFLVAFRMIMSYLFLKLNM